MSKENDAKAKVVDVLLGSLEQIDDYFEYRCRSEEDQMFVHAVLGEMEKKIRVIHKADQEAKGKG